MVITLFEDERVMKGWLEINTNDDSKHPGCSDVCLDTNFMNLGQIAHYVMVITAILPIFTTFGEVRVVEKLI